MGSAPSRPLREPVPAGVIETLGTAFTLLNRRPYLMLVLVALDCLQWLGPRISGGELFRLVGNYLTAAGAMPTDQRTALQGLGADFDLLLLLTTLLPSLVAVLGPQTFAVPFRPPVVEPVPLVASIVLIGLFIFGVVLGMCYWTILGAVVRGERLRLAALLRTGLRNSVMMLTYFGILFLGLMGITVVATLALAAATIVGLGIAVLSLATPLFLIAGLVFYVGTFFVEDAIVLSGAGPFRAVQYSIGILRVAFWPTLRFIGALSMIQLGLPLALRVFTGNVLAIPFALVSYAYVATALILASLLFYRARVILVLRGQAVRASRTEVEERR